MSKWKDRKGEWKDAAQESFKGIPGPSGCQPAADGAAGRDIETDDQPDRARWLFTVGHTGAEDCKSMQCKGRRYFSVWRGRRGIKYENRKWNDDKRTGKYAAE